MTRKSDTPRSRTEFQSLYFGTALLLAIIIQSLSLSNISSLICSSSSSLISEVIAFVVCFFFVFLFNASASASLTSLSISYILKTNFPLIAICFPFLHSLHTYNSSLYLAFSFYKRVFLDVVLLRADPDCSIYCFIEVLIVEERTILLTSDVASRSSIPSGGELSSREWSRSFRVVKGGRVVGVVKEGIRRVERIVIGLRG
jgi:hypothetical protein